MGCTGDKPQSRKYEKEMTQTLQAQLNVMPQWYAAESQYQPLYQELANKLQGISMLGREVEGGTLGLYKEAMPQLAELDSMSRAANLKDLQTYGPQMVQAMMESDPEAYALLQEMTRQASGDLALGSSLSADERQLVQNQVRAGQAARGMGYGPADVYEETLGASAYGNELKNQRRGYADQVTRLRRQMGGDAASLVLGQSSGVDAGNAYSQAAGISAGAGPGLYNPESAYAGSLYAQNKQARDAYAASQGGTLGKIGKFTGLATGLFKGISGGVGAYKDMKSL